MAFPTGWRRKCPLVIQASEINSDLTDFPVLLTKDTLPLEMFDADGSYPTISGGGDIRFSSDSDGNNRLACEVITFTTDNDPNNGKAEIWVKVPTVSSGVDTTFYVWYNKTGETQPTSSGTYGSENVWDNNFKGVWHLNQDPSGTAPQELDSTANNNDGTSNGSMTSDDLVEGQVDGALDFDGSDDYIDCGNGASLEFSTNDFGVGLIFKTTDTTNTPANLVGKMTTDTTATGWRVHKGDNNDNYIYFDTWEGNANSIIQVASTGYLDGEFHYLYVGRTDTTLKIYLDGIEKVSTSLTKRDVTNSNPLWIGKDNWQDSNPFDGIIDEVRVSNVVRPASWNKACYNNQNDPSAFVIEGTPEYANLYFSGYVFEQNNPVSRKLYLHNRSTGELINTTTSSDNGYYYMETTFSGSHYIVCLDDDAGTEYNDLIIGRAFPTTVSG